jgi:anti-sigma B factor antagonist
LALNVRVVETRPSTKTVHLEGKLNNETVAVLDEAVNAVTASQATVVVFDLAGLEYISSVGLRSIFRAQKAMAARNGKTLLVNPQPQVKKVFDIVNAADLTAVFASIEELDRYLDLMQRKVVEGE